MIRFVESKNMINQDIFIYNFDPKIIPFPYFKTSHGSQDNGNRTTGCLTNPTRMRESRLSALEAAVQTVQVYLHCQCT